MPPKKPKKGEEEPKKEEESKEEAEEEAEPPEPDIHKKCFRVGGQLYYGDVKAGYRDRKGLFIRHGFGRQVDLGVSPAGKFHTDNLSWETVIIGRYEGNFFEDTLAGLGTYKWSDGSTYEGQFVDSLPSGHGRFTWPDGSAYEGHWEDGAMHGQGRLESRFDGKASTGRHQRNCFQHINGKWVNILEKLRLEEIERILHGDASSLSVRRCALGEYFSNSESDKALEQQGAFTKTLRQLHADDLVPFVVAEESVPKSALECLQSTGFVDCEQHCASVRLAAVARRRHRDCHRFFFDAIQKSLESGNFFVMHFEDDDAGCALLGDERLDWYKRKPAAAIPSADLPEDWQLPGFFQDAAFPAYVLQPVLFNGRGLSRFFLPELPQLPAPGAVPPAAAAVAGAVEEISGGKAAGAEDQSASGAAPGVESALAAAAAAAPTRTKEAVRLSRVAAEELPSGNDAVGPSGWFFEAKAELSPPEAGLLHTPLLRPVVSAYGRVTENLDDAAVQGLLVGRFGKHVPMHRTAVVVITMQEPADLT